MLGEIWAFLFVKLGEEVFAMANRIKGIPVEIVGDTTGG